MSILVHGVNDVAGEPVAARDRADRAGGTVVPHHTTPGGDPEHTIGILIQMMDEVRGQHVRTVTPVPETFLNALVR